MTKHLLRVLIFLVSASASVFALETESANNRFLHAVMDQVGLVVACCPLCTDAEHFAIIDMALADGADINCAHTRYGTALFMAVSKGHPELVDHLLKKGADRNVRSPWDVFADEADVVTPAQKALYRLSHCAYLVGEELKDVRTNCESRYNKVIALLREVEKSEPVEAKEL